MEKRIFVASGGSGSMHFISKLRMLGFHVGHRPDTSFLITGTPHLDKSEKYQKRQRVRTYEECPLPDGIEMFRKRSGFVMDPRRTLDQNMRDYVKWVLSDKMRVAVLTYCPVFSFLSRNRVSDVLCIVRHPLHQYISYTKRQRHYEFVKGWGGVNKKASVRWFAEKWNLWANDMLGCGGLIFRYEHLPEEAQSYKGLRKIFSDWDGSRRNWEVLLPEFSEMLRQLVWKNFVRLYGSVWEL